MHLYAFDFLDPFQSGFQSKFLNSSVTVNDHVCVMIIHDPHVCDDPHHEIS